MPGTHAVKAAVKEAVKDATKDGAKPLTEAALRKMPVSQYMNEQQLDFFREQLLQMQRELMENASHTSEHLREHEAESDVADQATIEEENALELRTRDRERKLLLKIGEALRRIDDGSYGYCEETGEAIGIPRLLARPTATLSIDAQTRREQKQKLFGR
jgi:DnaK suppressor protein